MLSISASVLLLVGCSPARDVPQPLDTDSSSLDTSSSVNTTSASPDITSAPDEASENQIPWDLFPGLKAKLDQLVIEQNCDALNSLKNEFSNKEKSLDGYLQKAIKDAKCD